MTISCILDLNLNVHGCKTVDTWLYRISIHQSRKILIPQLHVLGLEQTGTSEIYIEIYYRFKINYILKCYIEKSLTMYSWANDAHILLEVHVCRSYICEFLCGNS